MTNTNEPQTQHMTAEEKMRAEFEAAKLARMKTVHPEDDYIDYSSMWVGWQACAAQSAETIAMLEEKVSDLSLSLLSGRASWNDENKELREQLSAAQLNNKQLMESVTESMHAAYRYGRQDFGSCFRQELEELLAQPLDTSALDAYVASKMPAWQKIETAPKEWNCRCPNEDRECEDSELCRECGHCCRNDEPLPPSPNTQEKE